ncbi:MAG: polysaccharide deacetylase family protein [Chloroflexi bacterium]|nr:polysaccharide deacetylase family protein [Chloroflexota bacterium]
MAPTRRLWLALTALAVLAAVAIPAASSATPGPRHPYRDRVGAAPVLQAPAWSPALPLPHRQVLPLTARDGFATDVRYMVRPGDNLYAIARRYGTTSAVLATRNGLANKNAIRPGQELLIFPVGPAPAPPPAPASAAVISRGPSIPMVAFSFDAGSDVGYTSLILDVLKANGITASFGMTGAWADQNPSMLRRIVNEGHHLINHSYNHPDFTTLTTAARWDQLDRADAAVTALTGLGMKPYFRPPFGSQNAAVNADLAARGYYYNVMWTVDSWGWMGLSAADIISRCLSRAEPGAIFLYHVGIQSQDGPALQAMIDGFRAQGYAIGSVADVLGH